MYPLLTAARFHDWKTVMAATEPTEDLPISRGLRHYARGVAFAADGDVDSATAERNSLDRIIASLPMESRYGNSPAKEVLSVGVSIVDARIAQQKGDLAEAAADLGVAVAMQDKLAYNEPADWHYPVRESLGAALLKVGQGQRGRGGVPRRSQEEPARRPLAVRAGESLEAQGKTDEAMLVRQEFDDAWRTAEIEPNSTPCNSQPFNFESRL